MAGTRTGRNEDALSEIVGFVLVLALVVVASTLYLMYVVPAEGREDEIEQMNQVQDRFVSYKTSVDGLWMRSLADLSVPGTRGVSLSTSFDLGTGGGNTQSSGLFLSFMRPIGTAAKMRTQLDSDPNGITTDWINMTVDGVQQFAYEDNLGDVKAAVPIGALSYHTDNFYWIQQVYHYKLGGVFLEQPSEGVSVKVAPPIALYMIKNVTGGTATDAMKVSLSLVNVSSPNSTVGGTGPLRVETRLRESLNARYRNEAVGDIGIRITHPEDEWLDAWHQVFENAAQKSGVPGPYNSANDRIEIVKDLNDHYVELDIKSADAAVSKDVFLDLTEATLQVTFEYDE